MDSTIDLAEYLFMRRCSQKEIAARVGRSESTVSEVGLVDYIDCFMAFGQWMTQHAEHAEAIRETMSSRTDFWENFTKAVNIIQDKYITSLTKDGGQR